MSEQQEPKADDSFCKKYRIFIRNLVFDINEKMLQKLFSPFGKIQEINIVKNPENNKPLGFAFVQLDSSRGVNNAIQKLHGSVFKGRTIDVSKSVD
jgi:RNA recognition motif-containing protein